MVKRVGAALLEALKRDGAARQTRMRGFALSENDAEVLSFISHRPCSIMSHIAEGVALSQTAVKWHARKLVKVELLACRDFRGRAAFCPVGMLTDAEAEIFSLLAFPEKRAALRNVIEAPGSSQDALAGKLGVTRQSISRTMREMSGLGLVAPTRDGRAVRYYPTELLAESGDAYSERRKALLDGTLARLSGLGLKPKVIKSEPAEVHILIGAKGMQANLRLGLNPYQTVFWD